jgi:hypothetical protein
MSPVTMGPAARQRRLRVVVGLAAAVAVLLVAGVLGWVGRSKEAPERRSADAVATSGATHAASSDDGLDVPGVAAGSPTRLSRDERGAAAAAVTYTAASQRWLYLTDEGVAEDVAGIATPQSVDTLVAEVVAETAAARAELAGSQGRVWWWVHPLAWRVEAYSDDEASVAVWTVTVLSATGVAVPQSEWMTVTVQLAWVEDGWRVEAVRDRPGPTPITGTRDEPWDAVPFDEALDGFTRLGVDAAT